MEIDIPPQYPSNTCRVTPIDSIARDSPTMMPTDLSILNHSEEDKGEPTLVLKLIDQHTENAANTVLPPGWEVWEQTSTNDMATLLTPLESLHLSADDSSDTSSEGLSLGEAEDGHAVPFDSAPDLTLKPAVWSELELGAGYMDEDEDDEDEDEDEDEGNEQMTYTLPSYESLYGASRPCPSRMYVGAYQPEDTLSRYRYVGKPNRTMTSRRERYIPYTPRASSSKLTVGSVILERMKELADNGRTTSLGYERRSQAGTRSSIEQALSKGRKDRQTPLTHRQGMNVITHQFGSLVLGV